MKKKVVLRLLSNMVGNSDDKTNFPHKLLLSDREVANYRNFSSKAFVNYLPTDIRLTKTQLSKMIQSGGFLGRLLGPLIKTGLPLMKNVTKPLALISFNSVRINCSSISSRCWNT